MSTKYIDQLAHQLTAAKTPAGRLGIVNDQNSRIHEASPCVRLTGSNRLGPYSVLGIYM